MSSYVSWWWLCSYVTANTSRRPIPIMIVWIIVRHEHSPRQDWQSYLTKIIYERFVDVVYCMLYNFQGPCLHDHRINYWVRKPVFIGQSVLTDYWGALLKWRISGLTGIVMVLSWLLIVSPRRIMHDRDGINGIIPVWYDLKGRSSRWGSTACD